MAEPLWKFDGYETAAGRKVVREWFLYELNQDERDAIRDRLRYLQYLPNTSWTEPAFKNFGNKFGEIRQNSQRGPMRIYGIFVDDRFVMLHGCHKKKNKDSEGMNTAKLRLKEFNKKNGSAREFNFEEEPVKSDSPEQSDEGEAS